MKRLFPVILLLFVVGYFFSPFFLKGLVPIPADNIIGLYHPFRDMYASEYPQGIPYKNYLLEDPIQQQYPWRELAISLEKKMQLPLWNPYNFSGMPLMANLQSAVLYPLNILFFLMPFPTAWSLLIVSEVLLSGLFMYWYLRNLSLRTASSLLGSLCFALGGFSMVWMEWGSVTSTGLWLPLILLAIDKILSFYKEKPFSKMLLGWAALFVGSLCASFFAGHLQTFLYLVTLSCAYLLLQLFGVKGKIRLSALFIGCAIIFLLLTAIQWIPLFQLISLSARDVDHMSYLAEGWFFPWSHIANFVVPDFFGNPATLNYWGVWNYSEFSGYIGIVPLTFAFLSILFRRDKKTYFFLGITVVSILFAFPTFVGMLPFQLHIPFLATSQPSRLVYLTDFCLSVLAALGLDYFEQKRKYIALPLAISSFLLLALWAVVLWGGHLGFIVPVSHLMVAKHNLYIPSMILGLFIMLYFLFLMIRKRYSKVFLVLLFGILALSAGDLIRYAQKFTPFSPAAYLYPQTTTLAYLEKHQGINRMMELDRRVFPPNFSTMYHLPSVDGYDPLYIKRYGELIAASERGKPDITPPFGFNRIITPQRYESEIMNLLGVKYMLSLSPVEDPHLKKVWQEGQTITYENTLSYPRAFFVADILKSQSKQQAITMVFAQGKQLRRVGIVEGYSGSAIHFSVGTTTIEKYEANHIVLQTTNPDEGFLILTDVFYPSWKAYIDGYPTPIYPTDVALRGIRVPKGTHTIAFEDTVF